MAEQTHNEINDCRPQVLEHFIGQQSIVKRCQLALEYAWNPGALAIFAFDVAAFSFCRKDYLH